MENTTGGSLTLVGTPIGNLSDVSPRALEALSGCDFIAAEDTRVTLALLNHFDIKKPLVSYHEHNKRERGAQICDRLAAGENAVLVSDAGMPAISDPGEDLVRLCHERNIPVTVVPGPCAAVTALALSGMPAGRFTFEGFLPQKKGRATRLESLQTEERTMIFYESPYRVVKTLTQFVETFGAERRMSACREISKLHEESVRGTIAEVLHHFEENAPRGEFVLVVEGAETAKQSARKARRERARKDSEEEDSTTDF